MNETRFPKGSALDNALWPLKYVNKNPDLECKPLSVEGAAKLLREFDAAFPAVKAMVDMDRERRKNFAEIQQIPRS